MGAKRIRELDKFLTKQVVAEHLSCSTKTVERMFNEGLESIKIKGRRLVPRQALLDFINRQNRLNG